MVERFNRTLKMILHKHAATYGNQWDRYLFSAIDAYRNMPHESTGEKPNHLLFGIDCRTPTEAAFLPPSLTNVADYREELTMALSTARNTAVASIQKTQRHYKQQYDKDINPLQV